MKTLLLFLLLVTVNSLHAQCDSLLTGHKLASDLLRATDKSTKAPREKKTFLFFGCEKRRVKDPRVPEKYATIRRIQGAQPGMPYSTMGAGIRYSVFALEANMFSGKERKWWYLTPKANVDFGNVSVFYGYGLPVGSNDLPQSFRHSLSVKYRVHVQELFHGRLHRQQL